MYSNLVLESSL